MMIGMLRDVLLEPPAHLPAVELGDHDVEQHQLGPGLAGLREGIGTVGRDPDVEAFLGQVADHLGHVLLVLHDQDAAEPLRGGRAHGCDCRMPSFRHSLDLLNDPRHGRPILVTAASVRAGGYRTMTAG
jgi:hypothetical protein